MSGTAAPVDAPSFRPDVFEVDPPRLFGSSCSECGAKAFPPRAICPRCGGAATARAELGTAGTVYSFTIVRQAPPGLTVPYVLSYVDLPDDEVRVMARLVGREPEAIAVGDQVSLDVAPAEPAGAEPALMYVFTYDRMEVAR